MKYKWLQKNNNTKLIVFYNGWGMDENAVKHLDCEDYDVLVLYDYNDLNFDMYLSRYEKKHIIGWSMGVMIIGTEQNRHITENANSYTAIAGTPIPIDDKYGIPKRIYELTVKGFNETSSKRFILRMGEDVELQLTERDFESQKSELIKLMEYKSDIPYKFDKVIIPRGDLIIPVKNQINYWSENFANPTFIKSGHYPFLLYNKWSELI